MVNVAIVTLLFTDLVGSSELLDRLGDDDADRLRKIHFGLLRDAVAGYGGEEVKNLGDGLMVVFPSAMDAISCAIAMQQAVARHNQEHPALPINVRIGLHAGEPVQEDNDYFGRAVVIAKRICDKATGGQIVASELVQNIIGRRGGFAFSDLGPLELKGIAAPVPAREVVWDLETSLTAPKLEQDLVDQRQAQAAQPAVVVPRVRTLWSPRSKILLGGLILVLAAFAALRAFSTSDEAPSPRSAALAWNRVDAPEAGFTGIGDQRIHRVASDGAELLAVGYDTSLGNRDAAVWRSADGLEWERDRSDALGGPGGQLIWGVTFQGSNVVAVGYDGSGGDLDAAVWSSEGTDWTREAESSAALGGPGPQVMNRVASGAAGLVAVGYSASAGQKDAAVWISDDASAWERIPDDGSLFGGLGDQEIRSVAIGGDRIVAVGSDTSLNGTNAAVWTSDDGVDWVRLPNDRLIFGGPSNQVMTAVTALEDGFVAVGWDTARNTDAAAWTSPDGIIWHRSPADEAVLGGEGSQQLFAVNQLGSELVAVGRNTFGGGSDAAVWTSPDGVTWSKLEIDEAVLGGDRSQQMRWVTVHVDRLIGAGWDTSVDGSDAAVWWADISGDTR